jgi:hypothetical protein
VATASRKSVPISKPSKIIEASKRIAERRGPEVVEAYAGAGFSG